MPGDELAGHKLMGREAPSPRPALGGPGITGRWLSIFGGSLGALLIRFLVPTPVGQADNRDGPRLTCGLGLGPITGHHPRFYRFAYFEYVTRRSCEGRIPYPS